VQAGFEFKEFRGTSPDVSIPKMISLLRKRAQGKIGYKKIGQRFKLVESHDLKILYMAYAVKPLRDPAQWRLSTVTGENRRRKTPGKWTAFVCSAIGCNQTLLSYCATLTRYRGSSNAFVLTALESVDLKIRRATEHLHFLQHVIAIRCE
jgi:hypothetical protein